MVRSLVFVFEELICYVLGYRMLFRMDFSKKKWIYIMEMALVISAVAVIYELGGASATREGVLFIGLTVPLLMSDTERLYRLALYPTVFIGTTVVYVMNCVGYGLIRNMSISGIMGSENDSVIVKSLSLCIMLIILMIVKRTLWTGIGTIKLKKKHILMYDLVCAGIFGMLGSAIKIASTIVGTGGNGYIYQISAILVSVCLMFLAIYSLYLSREREYQREQLEVYDLLANEQRRQVENMMYNDEAIRRLRHDMKAHLIALKGLGKSEDSSRIQEYCDNILGSIQFENVELSGDPAVDAVLSSMEERACSLGVRMEYRILSQPGAHLKSFDVCTIISNLLENALDACTGIGNERWIKCTFYKMHNKFCVKVENPCDKNVIISGDHLVTTKRDKENHGFGSMNVKRAVDKYCGQIHYRSERGIFEAVAIV